jgi:hypothetical protein
MAPHDFTCHSSPLHQLISTLLLLSFRIPTSRALETTFSTSPSQSPIPGLSCNPHYTERITPYVEHNPKLLACHPDCVPNFLMEPVEYVKVSMRKRSRRPYHNVLTPYLSP